MLVHVGSLGMTKGEWRTHRGKGSHGEQEQCMHDEYVSKLILSAHLRYFFFNIPNAFGLHYGHIVCQVLFLSEKLLKNRCSSSDM